MNESLEQSFRRFRERGSPQALARVYDETAAELLRVAMHLAPDAVAAEDLVQATFLTAIEKARSFDPSRPLVPWLVGILTNHAHAQRRQRRPVPVSELPEREDAAPPPDAKAWTAEFTETVDDAISRLPETYQPVLVLRLKHGMEPAEIAHALRRPPATVRTQLVRGLEKLRDLLPAAIASAIAVWITPTRGLAAIREVVVAHAAQAAGVGIGATLLGGILLMKKSIAVALIAVAAAVGYLMWPSNIAAPPIDSTRSPADAESTAASVKPRTADAPAADPARTNVPAGRSEPAAPTWSVTGRIEPQAGVPLANAVVRAFRGTPTDRVISFSTLMELSARQGDGYVDESRMVLDVEGDAVAVADVEADGTFRIEGLSVRDVRLVLDHRFYAFPQILPAHAREDGEAVDLGVVDSFCGGQIIGRVVSMEPLADAHAVLSSDPDPMQVLRDAQAFLAQTLKAGGTEATPDSSGRFEFRAVAPSPAVRIALRHDDAVAIVDPFPVGPGETIEVLLHARPSGTLNVTARDETGALIDDVRVRVRPTEVMGQFALARLTKTARTTADGSATLRGLRSGTYIVHAEREGLRPARVDVQVVEGSESHADVQLVVGAVVSGTVVDADGEPIADAGVAFVPDFEIPMLGRVSDFTGSETWARAAARSRVRTDSDGRFQLGGAPDGDQAGIAAHHPEFVGGLASGVVGGSTGVEIVLARPGRVRGRAVAADGSGPIRSFEVRTMQSMVFFMERATAIESVEASEDGTFELAFVPPGRHDLRVEARDLGAATQSIEIVAGETTDVGDVAVSRAGVITGVVLDAAGEPVAGAVVSEARHGLAGNPLMSMFFAGSTVQSEADGSFHIEGLGPGRVALRAVAEGHASARSRAIEVRAGAVVDGVELRMGVGGSIAGRLLLGPGHDFADWDIIVTQEPQTATQVVDPNPDGTFRVDNLDPGRYQVQAMDATAMQRANDAALTDLMPGGTPDIGKLMQQMQDFLVMARARVSEGEVTEVELDASDFEAVGTDLVVTVLVGGRPLEHGFVEAVALHGDQPEGLRIGFVQDGDVRFQRLPEGLVRLQARSGLTMSPVGEPWTIEIPERGGLVTRTWELPGGSIEGQVVDAESGDPLPGAMVRLIPDGAAAEGREHDVGFALTDRDGGFSFRGLGDGTYSIVAEDLLTASRRTTTSGRVDGLRIAGGVGPASAVLRTHGGAGVAVRITAGLGAPLRGARLLAIGTGGSPLGMLPIARTDELGEAFLSGLPGGATRIVAWAEGYAPGVTEAQEVRPDRRTDFSLALESGTDVSLRLVDADGSPLGSAAVALRWGDGPWIPTLLFERAVRADGTLELGPLPAGPVSFRVVHPRARFQAQRVVPSGARASFVLQP